MYAVCIRSNSKTEPLGSECFKHLIMVMLSSESFCYLTALKLIYQVVHGSWKGKTNCKETTQWPRLQASVKHPACSGDFTASLGRVIIQLARASTDLGCHQMCEFKDAGQDPMERALFPSRREPSNSITPPISMSMSQLRNPSVPLTHHQNFDSRTKCHKFKR